MSFDYELVVRTGTLTRREIRAAAEELLARHGRGVLLHSGGDDDRFHLLVGFDDSAGSIEVRRLREGYQLRIDASRDGNRDTWDELGDALNALAAAIGETVDDDEAAQMIADTDGALTSIVVIDLEDRAGNTIQTRSLFLSTFLPTLDPGNMPTRDARQLDPLFDEDTRVGLNGVRLVALLHDSEAVAFRRHTWTLDGRGRITAVATEDLG